MRRHRAAAVVAATILVALLVSFGAWYRTNQDAQQRQAKVDQQLETLFTEAATVANRARRAGATDWTLWEKAEFQYQQALRACPEADPAIQSRGQAAIVTLRQERDRLKETVALESRQQAFLLRLEQIRIPTDFEFAAERWRQRNARRMADDYRTAFTKWLAIEDPNHMVRPEVSARLRGDIQIQLAQALDLWVVALRVAAPDDEATSKRCRPLINTAIALDSADPRLRDLRLQLPYLNTGSSEPLQMVQQLDHTKLTVHETMLFAEALLLTDKQRHGLRLYEIGFLNNRHSFTLCLQVAVLAALDQKFERAADYFRVAQSLRPENSEPSRMLAYCLQRSGQLNEARRIYEHLLTQHPDAATHALLTEVLLDIGDNEEAQEQLRQASRLAPEHSAFERMLAGRVALQAGQHDQALRRFRDAVRLDGEDNELAGWLGSVLARTGRHQEAIPYLRQAMAESSHRSWPLWSSRLAMALASTGQLEQAAAVAQKALASQPDAAVLHLSMGKIHVQTKDYDVAERSLMRALYSEQTGTVAAQTLADLYRVRGDTRRSDHYRGLAQRTASTQDGDRVQKIIGELVDGRQRVARLAAAKYLDGAPTAWSLLVRLGAALNEHGQTDLAERAYRRVLSGMESPDARVYSSLAHCLFRQGRYTESIDNHRTALRMVRDVHRLSTNTTRAIFGNAAFALWDDSRMGEALAVLAEIPEDDPFLVSVRLQLRCRTGLLEPATRDFSFLRQQRRKLSDQEWKDANLPPPSMCRSWLSLCQRRSVVLRRYVDGEGPAPKLKSHKYEAAFLAHNLGQTERAVELFDLAKKAGAPPHMRDYRRSAARAALRLVAAKPSLAEPVKSKLRHQALSDLQSSLADHQSGRRKTRLHLWLFDRDMAMVRDTEQLAKLPTAERQPWAALWRTVRDLAAKKSK